MSRSSGPRRASRRGMSGMKPENVVSLFIIYTLVMFIIAAHLLFQFDRTLLWWPLVYLLGVAVFFKILGRR